MNAIDMWLASTLDLPWTPQSPVEASPSVVSGDADVLDIELLSELIATQDTGSTISSTDSESDGGAWADATAAWAPDTAGPAGTEQVDQLSKVAYLDTEQWLNAATLQPPPAQKKLLDSLTDFSSLSISPTSSSSATCSSSNVDIFSSSMPDLTAVETTTTDVSKLPPSAARATSQARPAEIITKSEENDFDESPPQKRPRKTTRRIQPPKDSPAYRRRRNQNNQAVRRCRIKTKERNEENQRVADDLREENTMLRERLSCLFREVRTLRAMMGMRAVDDLGAMNLNTSDTRASSKPMAATCNDAVGNSSFWQGLGATFVL